MNGNTIRFKMDSMGVFPQFLLIYLALYKQRILDVLPTFLANILGYIYLTIPTMVTYYLSKFKLPVRPARLFFAILLRFLGIGPTDLKNQSETSGSP